MIAETVSKILPFYGIEAQVEYTEWSERPDLKVKRSRGVYIIYDDDHVFYIGKGFIRDRQKMHKEKFLGEFRAARDTRGFKNFRSTYGILDLTKLKFCYIIIESETAIGAVETGLIHLLQPLANDETQ